MYKKLSGKLIWFRTGALPQASLISSVMQQKLSNVTTDDLLRVNQMLKKMKVLIPVESLRPAPSAVGTKTLSDASFNISMSLTYGQTDIICGLHINTTGGNEAHHCIQ